MYPIKKLSEITSLITKGSTPTTYGYSFLSEGINFIKIENISNGTISKPSLSAFISKEAHLSQKRSILEDGDFLVSIAGTIGSIALVTKDILPANTNQALAIVRGYQDFVNKDFLRYIFLSSLSKGFKNKARGGALQNISLEDIKNIEIPLPPLSTQSKIVAKLDEAFGNIDRQISLLKANIEDVESVRKSAMEESFQSGEYEVKKLGSLATFLSGGTPSKSNKLFWIGDIPWISPKDMKRAKIDSATDYVSQLAIDSSATRILPPNSLLCVTRSGILIHSFPVAINTVPVSFNQDIRAIVPSKGLNSEYLFYALKAKERDILSNGVKKGPTVHSIISGYLDKLEIPLPPLPRQHEIVEHLDRVFAQTAELRSGYEAQIRDLETLRQSLLEEAFAGRLVSED